MKNPAIDAPLSLPPAKPLIPFGAPQTTDTGGAFLDTLIDAVNPLQHLPVVSSLYREASGDGISGLARMAGGALFGGIPGLVVSAATTLFDAVAGEDPGEMAISALKDLGAAPEGAVSAPLLDDGSPLAADNGQALVDVALAMRDAPPPVAPVEQAAADALKIPGALAAYRDDSFGFENEGKREQYVGSLDEIAMNM